MPTASEMPWGPEDPFTNPSPRAAPCSPPTPPKDAARACEITCTLGLPGQDGARTCPGQSPLSQSAPAPGAPVYCKRAGVLLRVTESPWGGWRGPWSQSIQVSGRGARPTGLREPEGLGCLGPPTHLPVTGRLVGQLEELDQVLPHHVAVSTLPEDHAIQVEEKALGRGERALSVRGWWAPAPSSVLSHPTCSSQGPTAEPGPSAPHSPSGEVEAALRIF